MALLRKKKKKRGLWGKQGVKNWKEQQVPIKSNGMQCHKLVTVWIGCDTPLSFPAGVPCDKDTTSVSVSVVEEERPSSVLHVIVTCAATTLVILACLLLQRLVSFDLSVRLIQEHVGSTCEFASWRYTAHRWKSGWGTAEEWGTLQNPMTMCMKSWPKMPSTLCQLPDNNNISRSQVRDLAGAAGHGGACHHAIAIFLLIAYFHWQYLFLMLLFLIYLKQSQKNILCILAKHIQERSFARLVDKNVLFIHFTPPLLLCQVLSDISEPFKLLKKKLLYVMYFSQLNIHGQHVQKIPLHCFCFFLFLHKTWLFCNCIVCSLKYNLYPNQMKNCETKWTVNCVILPPFKP